jgi:hypothetical protein
MSLKDLILAADDTSLVPVEVSEWRTTVYIKGMSGTDRDAFESETFSAGKVNGSNVRARLLVKTLCDDKGKRLFEDADAEKLGAKNGAVLGRLFDAARKANGMSPGDVAELEKN